MTAVAIIGAGRRIRQNLLPAITVLGWKPVAITSRTIASAAEVGEQWDVPAYASVESLPWNNIEVVVVSVSTTQVAAVLRQLRQHAPQVDLVLDTPPFAGARDLRWAGILREFKVAVVAEDFARFPQFDLMRSALAAGTIGEPLEVTMAHTGFRYHGTALARSFFGFPLVRSIHSEMRSRGRQTRFVFEGGASALVTGNYDVSIGEVTLRGSSGWLRYQEADMHNEGLASIGTVQSLREPDGTLTGFSLETSSGSLSYRPRYLADLRNLGADATGDFNLLKTCGTVEVLQQLIDNRAAPYGTADGIYDAVVSMAARVVPLAIDPGAHIGRLAMKRMGRVAPALTPVSIQGSTVS